MNWISTRSVRRRAGVEAHLRGVLRVVRAMYGVSPHEAEDVAVGCPGSEKRTRFLDLALEGVRGGLLLAPARAGLTGEIATLRRLPRRRAMG